MFTMGEEVMTLFEENGGGGGGGGGGGNSEMFLKETL